MCGEGERGKLRTGENHYHRSTRATMGPTRRLQLSAYRYEKGSSMYNFTFHIPTTIHFGKGQISHLAELAQYGKKALLCYGGGSIKRNGIYDEALRILGQVGVKVEELSGVEPKITAALPIFSVLTLSATGSEMDPFAVISDMDKNEKWGTGAECMKPTMSVLDPTYTFTVSCRQTAAGTADMMSHTFENYFTMEPGAYVQQRMAEGLLRTMIHYGPIALEEPDNYEARANLMWAASHAINGLVEAGAANAWCVHPMEHELSAFYDITHGEGLAILTPAWMEHVLSVKTAPMFATYGRNVWGLQGTDDMSLARDAIAKTREFFFVTMGMPANLRAVGIDDEKNFRVMAEKAAAGSKGSFVPLTADDIVEIYRAAL